jgi:hypothetical protein
LYSKHPHGKTRCLKSSREGEEEEEEEEYIISLNFSNTFGYSSFDGPVTKVDSSV